MPTNETFHVEPVIGAVPHLHGEAARKDWSAKGDDARPRRLSFRVPGRTVARPGSPGTPESTVPTNRVPAPEVSAAQAEPRPAGAQTRAIILNPATDPGARGLLDAWHENLDGLPATPAPDERTSRFGRIEHARAASIALQVPEAMLPSQIAYHAAFLDHEYAVAASFAQARASEPGLTCNEWARRNPFVPTGPETARSA